MSITEFIKTYPNELSCTQISRSGMNDYGRFDRMTWRLKVLSQSCDRCGYVRLIIEDGSMQVCSHGAHRWTDNMKTIAIGIGDTKETAWADLIENFNIWYCNQALAKG
jgi:hypothetical protein